MTVRAVVAVALALGVCGVALPLIEDATATRADAAGERAADAIADAAANLAESDATAGPGARQVVAVSLPEGPGSGVRAIAVGGIPGTAGRSVVAYRLDGGDWRVAARLPVRVDGDPLVVRGDARLTLRLHTADRGRVLRASAERL